jgi:hypothetical protein
MLANLWPLVRLALLHAVVGAGHVRVKAVVANLVEPGLGDVLE